MINATGTACNVCGSEVARILVEKDGHRVYQCDDCGLAFTYPQPLALDEQYDSSYFDLYRGRRDFRLRRGDARLRQIERVIAPGRLLDVGCSLGYFIEAAIARGWNAMGVEISPHACEEARKQGLDVTCAGVLDDAGFGDGSFDCVTMWDVLEHVPDPSAHMREVHRILAPGGIVVVGTPNLAHVMFRIKREKWRHLKPAEHIYYFQRSSILRLFDKAGLRLRSANGGIRINDVATFYGVKA